MNKTTICFALLAAACHDDVLEQDSGAGGGGGGPVEINDLGRTIDPPESPELTEVVPRLSLLVTNTSDPPPNPGIVPPPGVAACDNPASLAPGSLRRALAEANLSPGADTINSSLGGTISLNSVCKTLRFKDHTTWNSNLSLRISGDAMGAGDLVSVEGAGIDVGLKSVRLEGGAKDQRGVRVKNGALTMAYSWVKGMKRPLDENGFGAGILVRPVGASAVGSLTLSRTLVENNVAELGGAVIGGSGGGIYFEGKGKLTVSDSLIRGNDALVTGGGLVFATTDAPTANPSIIRNTTFTANNAGNDGGALAVKSLSSPYLQLRNVTISANTSEEIAAGISVKPGAGVMIELSTIADNEAVQPIGGTQIHLKGGAFAYLLGTVIRGKNGACGGPGVGSMTGSYNIWNDTSCPLGGLASTNALLAPLSNNGGTCSASHFACLTQKPQPGSPVIGFAAACVSPPEDQRHFARSPICSPGALQD